MSEIARTVSVQEIMQHLRAKSRLEASSKNAQTLRKKPKPGRLDVVLVILKSRPAAIEEAIHRIGAVPPGPNTLRGRIGATLIQALRRLLFWLTPSIQAADQQLLAAFRDQVAATEEIIRTLQQTRMELEALKRTRQLEQGLEAALAGVTPPEATVRH